MTTTAKVLSAILCGIILAIWTAVIARLIFWVTT